MEASSVIFNHSIVPDVLDDSNYEIWSSCLKDYLLGQDLWDVVEVEPEAAEETGQSSNNGWRKKNALALHAIKMSCGPNFLSLVVKVNSANEAWDLLATTARSVDKCDTEVEDEDDGDDGGGSGIGSVNILEQYSSSFAGGDDADYDSFVRATVDEDWSSMKNFIYSCPQALSARVFPRGRTALHHAVDRGQEQIATFLMEMMTANDMEMLDDDGFTPLAVGASKQYPGLLQLLYKMVQKNPIMANIGSPPRIPVVVASWRGLKDTTRFLYSVTDTYIFDPQNGSVGVAFLINCINITMFDIASELVEKFPELLLQENDGIYPIHALATRFTAFSSENGHKKSRHQTMFRLLNNENSTHDQARAFLKLVCSLVSTYNINTLEQIVYPAMIEAAINGKIEFINEMLMVQPYLIWANDKKDKKGRSKGRSMFWHAVMNRQEKVFNLIYGIPEQKDSLLWCENKDGNNILHAAALVAPLSIFDRTLGPALQMKRELQWFKEVANVVKPRYRKDLNNDKLTPLELFSLSHEKMMADGEKWMKETAQSYTVVGALIITIMFAVIITVPGGNNQETGYPLFVNKVLFKTFITFDSLSLFLSTTSVLVFLGIFTSNYAEDDFLLFLPRKLMIGVFSLFLSIATMMVTFCAALAIMFGRQLQFILPIVFLAFVPIVLFLSSIFPLLSKVYMSTFGSNMFDRNTKLPGRKSNHYALDVDEMV